MLFIIQNTLYTQYIHTLFLGWINQSHLINGTYLTLKNRTLRYLPLILTSSCLPPPSDWALFYAPPLPHSHAKWMAQMLLDKTVVPLGPLPLTIRSAWGPKLVFWSLPPPQRLPPLRANRHTGRGEMGRPRATRSEGRGQRSAKPCLGNMKKTYC